MTSSSSAGAFPTAGPLPPPLGRDGRRPARSRDRVRRPEAGQFDLQGKVAVATGASSGLGVASAEGLAASGADVAIGARRVERLEDTERLVEAARVEHLHLR